MEAEREPKRGVSLSVSNAVFSKLVKIGRDKGQTPQRAAQALFEAGYEAACMGKMGAASAPIAVVPYDPVAPQRIAQLEAEAKLAAETDGGLRAQIEQARQTIAGKDRMLLEQAAQIRGLTAERDALKADLAARRPSAAEICGGMFPDLGTRPDLGALKPGAIEPGPVHIPDEIWRRPSLPDEPSLDRLASPVPVRAIKGMAAAGNSAAEIARDLGLDLATVRQVLG